MISLIIEICIIALFILNIYLARKTKKLDLLIITTVFATLFENLHVYLFQNYVGGYYYSEKFLIYIYKTPLFVVLSWGMITLNAYLIASKLTNKVAKIFLVPILVVSVDFAMEFFAVRQGYWTWIGYDSTMGLFGVPTSNFISWILITLALVLCYEELEEKWIIPIVAYILFVFMATAQNFVIGMLGLNITQINWALWAVIAVLVIMTLALWKLKPKEEVNTKYLAIATMSRAAFYLFGLSLMIANWEFAKSIWPILVYAFLIEVVITIATYYKKRRIRFISSFS